MRALLHLLATVIVVPYAVLAAGFLALGYAIGDGSILGFFDRILEQVSWLVPWGIVGFGAAFGVIALLGLVARLRWIAGLLLSLVALVSLVVIVGLSASPVTSDQIVFLLPCAGASIVGASMCVAERARLRAAASAA